MTMEAFNDEMARQVFEQKAEYLGGNAFQMTGWDYFLLGWHCLLDKFATKTFVPREPVVVHLPDGAKLPDKLPEFEGITYPIGGKPKERKPNA